MENSSRSKKTLSTGSGPRFSRSGATPRPQPIDRTRSDIGVTRRPQEQNQNTAQGSRFSDIQISDVGNERDSTVSIRSDPFFRTYQSPQSTRLAVESDIAHGAVSSNEDLGKDIDYPQVNLVILGTRSVGKSTFIRRALDLRDNAPRQKFSKKMSLDGVVYVIRLLEVSLDEVKIHVPGGITWPRAVDGQNLPQIDGVMVLYDVTQEQSVHEIPDVLYCLNKTGTPCVLVSCKEDTPPKLRRVASDFNEQYKTRFSQFETCPTSVNVPESQKRCISLILRTIIKRRRGSVNTTSSSSTRSRASSTSTKSPPQDQKPSKQKSKVHSRASSELTALEFKDRIAGRFSNEASSRRKPTSNYPTSPTHLSSFPENSFSSQGQFQPGEVDFTNPPLLTNTLRPGTAGTIDSQAHNTFLIMEEESQEEVAHEVYNRRLSEPGDAVLNLARDNGGNSFDELVDRLLSLPMTKHDGKFVPVFLCLFRKFALPRRLFSALIRRFGIVERSDEAQLTKVGEQLRYLQVLALWTYEYPGDFAHTTIKKEALTFISRLERSRVFAYAAKEILNNLELAIEDEDAGWGPHDDSDEVSEPGASPKLRALSLSASESQSEEVPKSPVKDSSDESFEDFSKRSGAPSTKSSADKSSNQSQTSGLTRDELRQEAQSLVTIPQTRLSKTQWHIFMEIPDDDIAKELTRMDWVLYSSIRPRDLVRHVMSTETAQNLAPNLQKVDRMIDHFNHLFCFVSGLILLRDKPKHRALMLEKWMTIAWKVRQMNNYNSLGSILAGTNGTAVHRLTATWELVPELVRKNFMRLTILMGTMRSHGAYRMAWDNSFSERIPFLPVHRKDLVAAETANRTMVGPQGDRINWRKFEIMGEVILSMQKSQDKPFKLKKNEEIMKLVLDTRISLSDEDLAEELYERSRQVEPNGSSDRKKFDWLRR